MGHQLMLLVAFVLHDRRRAGPALGGYSTFRIEQAFGFNRTTVQTYVADPSRGLLLGALLGLPLAA